MINITTAHMYNYNDYLKDNLPSEQYITYINYCIENTKSNIPYNEYMDPDSHFIYNEYSSGPVYKKSKTTNSKRRTY
jgi:hypothetical protein